MEERQKEKTHQKTPEPKETDEVIAYAVHGPAVPLMEV